MAEEVTQRLSFPPRSIDRACRSIPRESCNIYSFPYRVSAGARVIVEACMTPDKPMINTKRRGRTYLPRAKLASIDSCTEEGCRTDPPPPRWKRTWARTPRPSASSHPSSALSSPCPVSWGTRGIPARGRHKRGSISSTDSARKDIPSHSQSLMPPAPVLNEFRLPFLFSAHSSNILLQTE